MNIKFFFLLSAFFIASIFIIIFANQVNAQQSKSPLGGGGIGPCPPIGDVNNDGYVNDSDADAVLKIVAKLDPYKNPTKDQLKRANVDTRNNAVTSVDALMIKRYIAGLDNTFRACPTPRVRIIYPNGGNTQLFRAGQTLRITWEAANVVSCSVGYKIFANNWELATVDLNKGYYDWTIDLSDHDFLIENQPVKIMMACQKDLGGDAGVIDESDNFFTVAIPNLTRDFKLLFTTKTYYDGNLGGLSGADSKCQQSAESAGLGGLSWKAWLSDNSTSAGSRLNHNNFYRNLFGSGPSWSDLTDGGYNMSMVDIDEFGNSMADTPSDVWTNTSAIDGAIDSRNQSCNNWASNSKSFLGAVGDYMSAVNPRWTSNPDYLLPCDSKAKLYCFEQ